MLKIVYPTCCGIDVHKKFIVACIASTVNGITTYKSTRFSTFTNGLRELLNWLVSNSCEFVCMESTGKYWIPVHNILETKCKVTLAHPKYVKAIRGKKTDKNDAKWIADLFKHGIVSGSFIPPLQIRELRDLMRYRTKLTNIRSGEKNRFQDSLTVSNIQISTVVSDTFGKSSMAIIDRILQNPLDTNFDISKLIHGSMLPKITELQSAIDGIITPEQASKLSIITKHYNAINDCKKKLEETILDIAKTYKKEIDLILTVPGIKEFSAITIISEIGTDMSVFPTSKHLCSWAGLTPTNNESAGKKKSVRISPAGAFIKPLLVQCANAIVKSKKHPEIYNRYLSIKKRRGHKKAIIAIARQLLTAIYHILKKNEPYSTECYDKYNNGQIKRAITIQEALLIVEKQGFKIIA